MGNSPRSVSRASPANLVPPCLPVKPRPICSNSYPPTSSRPNRRGRPRRRLCASPRRRLWGKPIPIRIYPRVCRGTRGRFPAGGPVLTVGRTVFEMWLGSLRALPRTRRRDADWAMQSLATYLLACGTRPLTCALKAVLQPTQTKSLITSINRLDDGISDSGLFNGP